MNQNSIDQLTEKFNLAPHPEGGFFCESYRSAETIETGRGQRSVSTAIYFLLRQGDVSHFHRIKSDELWHFYGGEELDIYEIDEENNLIITKLNSKSPQYMVKANRWFASRPAKMSSYSFVGCTVAPGFDFEDFEMAKKEQLLAQYPQLKEVISTLTLD